jgi:mannose-6-phosphate isomerase-like protein (cupin superfamily)
MEVIEMSMVNKISNGKIADLDKEVNASDLEWNKHPSFKGVYLKHLVKGETTNSKFSSHLIKIEAGYEIGEHIHKNNWELHEPIEGIGKGFLGEKEIEYELGVSVVIPEGVMHKVVAGDKDLYLLAKFIPALV